MNPFLVIFGGFLIVLTLEHLFPRAKLPYKKGWVTRAIFFNSIQFLVVLIASWSWEAWLQGPSLFKLPWSPFWNGMFAYLILTWVFFQYHYVRHENNFLWLAVHQFHHSPVRIEAITSFYKHPLEIIINSWIITILTCPILGLDAETNAWMTIFSALAEFFYHMNIQTPYWLGYFIQRPEMHLAHHAEDRQFTCNYGDISLWDILAGTWYNPTREETERIRTGFTQDRERKVLDMLMFKNVLPERPKKLPRNLFKYILINALFVLGCLNIIGVIFNSPSIKGFATMTTASPLPFVFTSYNGIETFSTTFNLDITFRNGSKSEILMDHKLYSKMQGPYQKRNMVGAVFSHGPFFKDPRMLEIRNQVLHWSFCQEHLTKEFGINDMIEKAIINVKSKTKGNEDKRWQMSIEC